MTNVRNRVNLFTCAKHSAHRAHVTVDGHTYMKYRILLSFCVLPFWNWRILSYTMHSLPRLLYTTMKRGRGRLYGSGANIDLYVMTLFFII